MAANFKPEQSIEEMLEIMNKNGGNTEVIHAGSSFIQYKLQERLLKDQNTYNNKQLFWSRFLAIATILLVIATLLLKFN